MNIIRSAGAGSHLAAFGPRWLLVASVGIGISGATGLAVGAEPEKSPASAPAAAPTSGVPKQGKVTLAVPRSRTPEASCFVEVSLGTMPRGARLKIRTEKGELVGAVAPFAQVPRFATQMHTLPLPDELRGARQLSLVLTMEGPDKKGERPATEVEVAKIALVAGP